MSLCHKWLMYVDTHPIVLYTFIAIFAEGSTATDDSAATNPENTSIREGKRGVICIFYDGLSLIHI